MNISSTDLLAEVTRALDEWPWILDVERAHQLPVGLLLAVGSRETNLTDEVGDFGHGHGVWQLDDRSHSIPTPFPVEQQANVAASMLWAGYTRAGTWQGACAIYNSGQPNDIYTTGRDYGADVMGRQQFIAGSVALIHPSSSVATAPAAPASPPASPPAEVSTSLPPKGTPHNMISLDPQTGGNWTVREDGSVFANDGAPYLGGLNNHPEWHAGGVSDPVTGIAPWGVGGSEGYVIVCDTGAGVPALYHFPRDGRYAK